jgi:hypothetical protein
MSKKPYKIKYWINVDMLAEDTIHLTDEEAENLNLKQYDFPTESAKYKVTGKIKVNRKTIENDEKLNNSNKK